jgi:SAM-dependent methyltransferase
MKTPQVVLRSLLAVCLSLMAAQSPARAQVPQQAPFEPQVGQQGKDVVWVPTADILVQKMLDMAHVTAADTLMDLGSGDGRTVIAAAKRGATAIGVEYNPDMVELSRKRAVEAGVTEKATFMQADLFETDLSKASVITLFLLPQINLTLRPKLLDLKPGTRVVSNTFTMEDWEADETANVEGECTSWCTALFWIVPAKVEGIWRLPQSELTLKQEFQKISGTLGSTPIVSGRLRGDEITFAAGDERYVGKVSGNSIAGTVTGGTGDTWTATKKEAAAQN